MLDLKQVTIMARTAKKIKPGQTVTVQTYTPDLFSEVFRKVKKQTCKVYSISQPWGYNGKAQACYLYFYE